MKNKKLLKLLGAIGLAVLIAVPLTLSCAAPAPAPVPAPAPAPAPAPTPAPAPAPTPPPAAEVVKWKLQSSMTGAMTLHKYLVEDFAEGIKNASGGQFIIEVYEAGALVKLDETFDAVRTGTIEATSTWPLQWQGRNTAFSLLCNWPFGPNYAELSAWYYYGDGTKLGNQLFAPYNIKFWSGTVSGAEIGPWSKVKYPTLESMKGRSARMGAGVPHDVMTKVGINAVTIAAPECYSALDRGVVDMLEYGQADSDVALRLYEVAKFLQMPAWHGSTMLIDLEVNMDAWNKLPDNFKAMFELGAACYSANGTWKYVGINLDKMEEIRAQGVEIYKLPQEDLDTLKEVTYEVMEELSDANPDFKNMWENQKDFMRKFGLFFKFAEYERMKL